MRVIDQVEREEEDGESRHDEVHLQTEDRNEYARNHECHCHRVQQGAAQGKISLGSRGVNRECNDNAKGETSRLEHDHWFLHSHHGDADDEGLANSEDQEKNVIEWHCLVQSAANYGALGGYEANDDED